MTNSNFYSLQGVLTEPLSETVDLFRFANPPRSVLVTYRDGTQETVKITPAELPYLDRVIVSFDAVARAYRNNDAMILGILRHQGTTYVSNLYERDGRVNNHQHKLHKDDKHESDIVAVHA